jgi:4-oxalocrotonate tautomerase
MPHITVKLWPGKTDQQKAELTQAIVEDVTRIFDGEHSVSVAMEEIAPRDWKAQVYDPDIVAHRDRLTKEPGYDAAALDQFA